MTSLRNFSGISTFMQSSQNIDTLKTVLSNKYDSIKLVARGGMGEIYSATHRILGKKVAIKVINQQMHKDKEVCLRFLQEAKLAASLDHPGIIQVMDYGSHDSFDYLVMPYVGGETLQEKLLRESFTVESALNVMIPIIEAISYAHRKNIIHRDIKPSNFLISDEGRIILTDFGISKNLRGEALTQMNQILGTPKFMSPEQITGKTLDRRSDLYSLGIIFYRLLTGLYPFTSEDPASLTYMHVHNIPKHPTEINLNIPAELGSMILKLLEKNPNNRYRDGESLLTDLMLFKTDIALSPKYQSMRSNAKSPQPVSLDETTRKLGQHKKNTAQASPEKNGRKTSEADVRLSGDMPTRQLNHKSAKDDKNENLIERFNTISFLDNVKTLKWFKNQKWFFPIGAGGVVLALVVLFFVFSNNFKQGFFLSAKTSENVSSHLRTAQKRENEILTNFSSPLSSLTLNQAITLLSLKVGILSKNDKSKIFESEISQFLNSVPYFKYTRKDNCDVLISEFNERGTRKIIISSNFYDGSADSNELLVMPNGTLPL
jgi:serine/threonine protein kinase